MNISISSIFAEPGYNFRVSYKVHEALANRINEVLNTSPKYNYYFGEEFDLGFTVSTKRKLEELTIQGPTVFKGDKYVDFTIWIPFKPVKNSENYLETYLHFLSGGIQMVFEQYDLNSEDVAHAVEHAKSAILSNPVV